MSDKEYLFDAAPRKACVGLNPRSMVVQSERIDSLDLRRNFDGEKGIIPRPALVHDEKAGPGGKTA